LIVKLNEEAVNAVELILKRGSKAVVQRNGQDIIVMEEKRKIEYRTDSNGSRERAI
jgi:hypothetical protein